MRMGRREPKARGDVDPPGCRDWSSSPISAGKKPAMGGLQVGERNAMIALGQLEDHAAGGSCGRRSTSIPSASALFRNSVSAASRTVTT